jgi:peptide/nickel transport system permease protein
VSRFAFVGRRLVQMLPVAVGVTILVFFMIHLVPGDPARTMLGVHATDRAVALLHHQWGLDRPLLAQYWLFLDRLLHANLGDSLYFRVAARSLIAARLSATLWLLLYAAVLSVLISLPLASIAATRKNGWIDQAVRAIPLVGLGMPSFWVGIILIRFLALGAGRLFPVGGYGEGLVGHLHSMFLPGLTVALSIAPLLIRSLRASMLSVLESEYVTTARSKGLSPRRVLVRHALRNAVIPTVTVLGINIGFLVGGTLVVESVFALPGIGNLMLTAIFNRDFPVVQGVTMVFAILVVSVNLLTDVAYSLLDPRVRFD